MIFSGYPKSASTDVFLRNGFAGISYSDGSEIEDRMLKIVRSAKDRSTASMELRQSISDWPTEYHLSPERQCLLRPFAIKPGQRVLELGCGCGAITRYLGEIGADVVGVEGGLRRAEIAAARCRDLPNVSIIAEDLLNFRSSEKFDWVLLVGVLEYAPVYSVGDDPMQSYLDVVKSLVADDGRLVVAIENKLGLKYFNGGDEDHIGRPFYGLQNLYRPNEPRTLGRKELLGKLRAAGFSRVETWYPFPDYKLPRVILSDAALSDPEFAPAELLASSYARDYAGGDTRAFNEQLVYREAFNNGILGDLSNSFLLSASKSDSGAPDADVLALVYSVLRHPEFATQTCLRRDGAKISVAKTPMFSTGLPAPRLDDLGLRHSREESRYFNGTSAVWRLTEARARGGGLDEMVAALTPWLKALLAALDFRRPEDGRVDDCLIPGDYIDATPFNLILSDKKAQFIDFEWRADAAIPLGWVITRSALWSLQIPGQEVDAVDVITAVRRLCASVDLEVTESSIGKWFQLEARFQAVIAGYDITLPKAPLSKKMPSFQQLIGEQTVQKSEIKRQNAVIERQTIEIGRLQGVVDRNRRSFAYRILHLPQWIGRQMKNFARGVPSGPERRRAR